MFSYVVKKIEVPQQFLKDFKVNYKNFLYRLFLISIYFYKNPFKFWQTSTKITNIYNIFLVCTTFVYVQHFQFEYFKLDSRIEYFERVITYSIQYKNILVTKKLYELNTYRIKFYRNTNLLLQQIYKTI